jgi:transcriptional regulator with XRE-family HTH domain
MGIRTATDVTASNLRGEMARQRRRQTDLAAVLHISQAAVSRRLSGETPLNVDELVAVAEWLDVTVGFLISERSVEQDFSRRRRLSDRQVAQVGTSSASGLATDRGKHSTCSASSDRLESLSVLAA